MPRQSEQEKLIETLRRKHSKLDDQVRELEARKWLSSADETEVRRLKVLKLAAKDRIEALNGGQA